MKYFFLSDGWTIGRVWELGGLWNESAWRRKPEISQINLCVWEQDEKLWLYRVEDAVLMVEVKPTDQAQVEAAPQAIGQVILKRLITADQAIERICASEISAPEPRVIS
ncbi:hypothetical protein [Stenomitos frigidus]|uniref:Uncharacterized protein n=1 Tax=Stenomitos frigidus ULC18 TaxID=2107698 RepID=A0A2T1EAX9_9CYAN|nr:hypothetical protein [Stenomitos frigidus]PSB29870.1 hypothetical protein C7B82_09960 [Stenomitos frigidus ULC18]